MTVIASSPSYFRGFTLIALRDGAEGDRDEDYAGNFQVQLQLKKCQENETPLACFLSYHTAVTWQLIKPYLPTTHVFIPWSLIAILPLREEIKKKVSLTVDGGFDRFSLHSLPVFTCRGGISLTSPPLMVLI